MLESYLDNSILDTPFLVLAAGVLLLLFALVLYLRSKSTNIRFVPIDTDVDSKRVERNYQKEYKLYMKSTQWEHLKKSALERAEHKCEKCGAPSEAVHHRSYPKDFKDDNLDNLLVLCHGCHYEIHKRQIDARKREKVYSDSVLAGRQHFLLEVKTAINGKKYLIINELKVDETSRFSDRKILIFEENLELLNRSLSKAIDFVNSTSSNS
jgi:hypothetical protein